MESITQSSFLRSFFVIIFGLVIISTPVKAQMPVENTYPAPSYPTIKAPTTVEEIMPYARAYAENESSFLGYGFGAIKPGEKVILVTTTTDPGADIYIEAIMTAIQERGVVPILMHDYEIVGVTLDEARVLGSRMSELGVGMSAFEQPDASRGWKEGCLFFGMNDHLQNNHPRLYELCNPPGIEDQLSPELFAVYQKMRTARGAIPQYINKYMDENPDIRGVFYGRGGPIWQSFQPNDRWLGMFLFDNMWIALAPSSSFPADVWMQAEELTMEPAVATDKVTVTNPMGVDVWWDLTEDQAQRWTEGLYLRGHLFMFPNEAYGSYGLSTTQYPARPTNWIPLNPIVKMNGTVTGYTSHVGYFPMVEQVWKDGYLTEVRGGGIYGELMRALMDMPGINDTYWPQMDEPGFLWHFETALGTNPKALRPDITQVIPAPERERDGTFHWGLGVNFWHDPGVPEIDAPSRRQFMREKGLPASHGFHIHTYMNTMKLHIRGSNRWVTVIEDGRSNSLDNPQTRALASRYGNPDEILATEWIPELPGINAPGNFEAFAEDPFTYDKAVMEQIKAGTYNKYNPFVRPPRSEN